MTIATFTQLDPQGNPIGDVRVNSQWVLQIIVIAGITTIILADGQGSTRVPVAESAEDVASALNVSSPGSAPELQVAELGIVSSGNFTLSGPVLALYSESEDAVSIYIDLIGTIDDDSANAFIEFAVPEIGFPGLGDGIAAGTITSLPGAQGIQGPNLEYDPGTGTNGATFRLTRNLGGAGVPVASFSSIAAVYRPARPAP